MSSDTLDTLDEPIITTLKRDIRTVVTKFGHVLWPRLHQRNELLHDWDLWGPLILCITLATLLREESQETQKTIVFTGVFVIVWCGSGIVTLNSSLLGGKLSFFQSICVLGYCILPLTLAAVFIRIMKAAAMAPVGLSALYVVLALGWSIFASMGFLGESQPQNRKALAVYPIVLFYLVIGWLIVAASI